MPRWLLRIGCALRGHWYKFSPRACVRCGKPLPVRGRQ